MNFNKFLDRIQVWSDRYEKFYDKFDHGTSSYSEERVIQRAEYHAFVRKTDFLSIDEFKNFDSKYAGKNLPMFVRHKPDNQPDGYYKLRVLGQIKKDQWMGYIPTSKYFGYQLKETIRFSTGAYKGATFDFSIVGVILFILISIVLFIVGITFRFLIALLLTLFQFIFVTFLAEKKPI